MNILVTGHLGFIGSHLIKRLKGHNIIGCDLKEGSDICNIESVEGIDLVFHLAANTNVPLSVKDPIFDFHTLQGSLRLIDACCRSGVPIIYISSSFVYGNGKRPSKETEPFDLTAPYGIVKNSVENYLKFYGKVYGLPYLIIRPATVYGPGQVGGAMADYIRHLKQGKQATIYGVKTRDYLYVSDLIDALMFLWGKEGIYNVGTGKETKLTELYSKIAGILGEEDKPILEEGRVGEVERQRLDCSKLRKLGWKPKISLEEGLRLTCR
jgi:nucleoside-diphosphate-sugar epimerase